MATNENIRIGIDVGGSSIKAALVDVHSGRLVAPPTRKDTPRHFERDALTAAILDSAGALDPEAAIGIGFPATIQHGVVTSRPTAHEYEGWIGFEIAASLGRASGRTVRVGNDADVAGLAEMRFGGGRNHAGVVLVLTLGTGVGSALFHEGRLVPNTELGKLYLETSAEVAEHFVASRIKTQAGLSWDEWGARLETYLAHVDRLFSPDLIILGGGISEGAGQFLPRLSLRCEVRAAELTNDAGAIGAARLVADEGVRALH